MSSGFGQLGENKVRVLFVMGFGRSGSTLLDNLLGSIPGVFSTGELRNLWRRGLVLGESCGCQKPVRSCEIWSKVLSSHPLLKEAAGMADQIARTQTVLLRTRRTLSAKAFSTISEPGSPLAKLAELRMTLYRQALAITGTQLIVDSSKWPADASLLSKLPEVEPFLVHLVRDSRAVAFSRRRIKRGLDREMRRARATSVAWRWIVREFASRRVFERYPSQSRLRVHYEDLAKDPEGVSRQILRLVGMPDARPPIERGGAVLVPNHSVAGNPGRHRSGFVKIAEDEEWRTAQSLLDRLAVTSVTWPYLLSYGYGLSARRVRPERRVRPS